jgi:hypothetical protein
MKVDRIRRTDKFGEPFEIGIGFAEDIASVLEMYRIFSPKPASQGLRLNTRNPSELKVAFK